MEKTDVLENISERTGGDIYLGVVGPVRTGKSTFIRRFMELLVLPNIEEFHEREIARDELPQSGTGRTVMTTEPKFIPANAVEINVREGIDMRVRMVDCVGYVVPGALGFEENEIPRMVHTPWGEEEIPFEEAAEIGTRKVITDHSTIGLLVTTDGSITEIERESYLEAEERVVAELKELDKPFVIILNSVDPFSVETRALSEKMQAEYDVSVVAVDAMNMTNDDVLRVLQEALYEFPVTEVDVHLPDWVPETDENHWLRKNLETDIFTIVDEIKRIRDLDNAVAAIDALEITEGASLLMMDLSTGISAVDVRINDSYFYQILGEYAGEEIEGNHTIMRLIRQFALSDKEWSKLREAMGEVRDSGYGVVNPQLDEMYLEEPELIKQGGRFGVKLKASAPSYHLIRANISTEITPLIGTEKQCEELVRYILEEFEDDPQKMWDTNIFGKSLNTLVQEGIQSKLCTMPETARGKLQITLERLVNDGGGGIICIIL
ncbi:MAG TPA: stage IV sporulation protein A [Clostridiales bacterium]|nr:stage IV sporulation protein A [Clostridiales bacterium]